MRWLKSSAGAVALWAVWISAAWLGCDAGGGSTQTIEDDEGSGATGATGGGGGGGEALPCGIDCSTIQVDQCSEAVCETSSGTCVVRPLNGNECDDGLFCTVGDTCSAGACTGTASNTCDLAPEPWSCQSVACDEATKTCSLTPLPAGTECVASDPCVVGATCGANGLCTGPVNDCFFAPVPDACHVAVCNSNSGECEAVPGNNGYPCLDSLCSQGGACNAGLCVGAIAKDCTWFGDACNVGSCNDASGACEKAPTNEGGPCSDEVGCTGGDACSAGTCMAGAAIVTCVHDDGCCATGCTSANDNDCQAILLFGDDLAASSWQAYRDALIAAGRKWDEVNYDLPSSNQGTFPNAATLANYDTVIIVAESQSDWPDADNNALVAWLEGGGEKNALIIGKDLIADWYNAGAGNGEFELYSRLGVTYLGGSASTLLPTVTGVDGDPISGSFFSEPLRLAMNTYSSGDYADQAVGPATHFGFYTGYPAAVGLNRSAMARYAPSYQVVWVGFNVHDGLVDTSQRNQLIVNILEWFKP